MVENLYIGNNPKGATELIKKFNANPESNSGIVTVPKVIGAGENITIPAGRVAVLPNVQVDGTLNIEGDGEVFIPTGTTFSELENQIATKADTSYVNDKYSGFKNYIINGGFDVWQRGDVLDGVASSDSYRADRWFFRTSPTGASALIVQKRYSNNYGNYLTYTYTDSKQPHYFRQNIENPVRFHNKTLTFSIDVINCSVEANFYLIYGFSNGTADVGSFRVPGLFTTHTDVRPDAIRYSFTFTIPDLTSYNLSSPNSFMFIGIQTEWTGTGTFRFGKIQLEEGSVATPFEQRPYGLELSLCQRYLPVVEGFYAGYAATSGEVYLSVASNVKPRVNPTGILGVPGGSVYYNNTSSPITNVVFFAGGVSSNTLKVYPTGTPLTAGHGIMVGLPKILFTGCEL